MSIPGLAARVFTAVSLSGLPSFVLTPTLWTRWILSRISAPMVDHWPFRRDAEMDGVLEEMGVKVVDLKKQTYDALVLWGAVNDTTRLSSQVLPYGSQVHSAVTQTFGQSMLAGALLLNALVRLQRLVDEVRACNQMRDEIDRLWAGSNGAASESRVGLDPSWLDWFISPLTRYELAEKYGSAAIRLWRLGALICESWYCSARVVLCFHDLCASFAFSDPDLQRYAKERLGCNFYLVKSSLNSLGPLYEQLKSQVEVPGFSWDTFNPSTVTDTLKSKFPDRK